MLAALMLASPAGVRADDSAPITLARRYKEGVTLRYRSTGRSSVSGAEAVSIQTTKYTVKELRKDGSVVMVVISEGGHYTLGDKKTDIPAAAPLTVLYDKADRMIAYQPEQTEQRSAPLALQHLIALASHVLLPEKAVKPEDTWQTEVDNPVVKGKKIVFKGTYLGTEKVGDATLWKVKQTADMDADADGNRISHTITAWLDPADGQPVKAEGKDDGIPTPLGEMSTSVELIRIKLDAEKPSP